jgi:hypothetical protein
LVKNNLLAEMGLLEVQRAEARFRAAVTQAADNYMDQSGAGNQKNFDRSARQIEVVLFNCMLSIWSEHSQIDAGRIGMFGVSWEVPSSRSDVFHSKTESFMTPISFPQLRICNVNGACSFLENLEREAAWNRSRSRTSSRTRNTSVSIEAAERCGLHRTYYSGIETTAILSLRSGIA